MKYPAILSVNDIVKIISDSPILSGVTALFLSVFSILYGPAPVTRAGMVLLILLIVIDWVTGFNAAKKDQIDTSSYGIEGLYRTMVLLLLPAIAHFVDLFFYTYGIASYFMIAALARHLLKSVVANTYRVGWTQWIPASAVERLTKWASDEIAHKDARAQERFEQIHKEDEK